MTLANIREELKKVDEEIEEVKSEMCDYYCKYTEDWKEGKDVEEICNKCPLNRL